MNQAVVLALMTQATELVERARRNGFVLTIDSVPNKPLAMGHFTPRVTLSPTNSEYRQNPKIPGAMNVLG